MGTGLPSSYAGWSALEPTAVVSHLPHCLRLRGEGSDCLSVLGHVGTCDFGANLDSDWSGWPESTGGGGR